MSRRSKRSAPVVLSLDEPISEESTSLQHDVAIADASLVGAVDRIALHRAWLELPEGSRKIFALHEIEGYQHQEIAALLGCTKGNSKSQLHRAKIKMRMLLHPKRDCNVQADS